MKLCSWSLLFIAVFVLSGSVCSLDFDEHICVECSDSPSGYCVQNKATGVITHQCAVGCYETPWPYLNAYCNYGRFECGAYPGISNFNCKDGSIPEVRCSTALLTEEPELSDCALECAAECGRRTLLADSCGDCTASDMCSKYPAGGYVQQACAQTCVGVCESNKTFCDTIGLLRMYAMFAAIILMILQGYKWMVSDDIEGRIDARRSIGYIIFGLLFIAVASVLVELFFLETIIC